MVRYRRLLLITAVPLLVAVGAMLLYHNNEPGQRGVVLEWSQALQQPGSHRIVTLPGDRFALDQGGTLEIFDGSGRSLATYTPRNGALLHSIVVSGSGNLCLGTSPGGLAVIDGAGKELFWRDIPSAAFTVVNQGMDGRIYAFSLISNTDVLPGSRVVSGLVTVLDGGGNITGEFPVDHGVHPLFPGAAGPDGTVYLVEASRDVMLYAYDQQGTQLFRQVVNSRSIADNPASICGVAALDGLVVVALRDDGLFAFDPAGNPLWRHQDPRLPLDADQIYNLAAGSDRIFVCNAEQLRAFGCDGSVLWESRLPGWKPQPQVGADGNLFVRIVQSSNNRFRFYKQLKQFNRRIAEDLRVDEYLAEYSPTGELAAIWAMPTGVSPATIPDENGVAYGTNRLGQVSDEITRLELPR